MTAPRIIHGNTALYPFDLTVDGADLVARNVTATWFGGPNDPGDNGLGASGFSSKAHQDFLGCSLPMQGWRICPGTPVPHLPWYTRVEVELAKDPSVSCETQLIDVGPAPRPHAQGKIDLVPAVFKALGVPLKNFRPTQGSLQVNFRIRGGAKFLALVAVLLGCLPLTGCGTTMQRMQQSAYYPSELRVAVSQSYDEERRHALATTETVEARWPLKPIPFVRVPAEAAPSPTPAATLH